MTQRPTDEFSDPRADDDGAPASASSAASGRGRRWEEPEDGNGELDGDDSDLGPLADRPSASRPQRRRRPLLGIAGLAVLVLATGAVLHTQESERRTPEAAVLEYVQLIEAGDIEAATELVPVLRQPEEPDPDESAPPVLDGGGRRPPVVALERLENAALLTNDFYADNPGLTVVSVEVAETPADPGVGESVDVAVDYMVEDSATSAVLRVEREPDSILGLPVWRIRDALTVPFVVSMRDGGLGSAYVDGARVAVSGEMSLPLYSSMLYPGVYTISFDGGTYLQAADLERRVTSPRSIVDPATAHAAAMLNVVPTAAANEAIVQEITDFLQRCAAATESLELCPEPYRAGQAAGGAATVRVSQTPFSFGVYSYRTGTETVQMISGSVDGTLTFPGEDRSVTEPFSLTFDFAIDDVEPRALVRSDDQDL